LAGRFLLAILAVRIVSRPNLLRIFQIRAGVCGRCCLVDFSGALAERHFGLDQSRDFLRRIFYRGAIQLLGEYIPLVFPLHLRGTGEVARQHRRPHFGDRRGVADDYVFESVRESGQDRVVGGLVAGAMPLDGALLTRWLPEPGREQLPKKELNKLNR